MSLRIVPAIALILLSELSLAAESGPAGRDRDQLWLIVNLKCMRHLAKSEAPIPCDSIDDSLGWERGVALLKAPTGRARMLAVPTHRVSGIEDAALLDDGEPNYFAVAWSEQYNFRMRLHAQPPASAVAVAVESKPVRDQDQLSLVVDCLDRQVAQTLTERAPTVSDGWNQAGFALKGRAYWVRRVDAARVEDVHPFQLLANELPGAAKNLADWSLTLVQPDSLKSGFLLLADKAEGGVGGRPQELLDPACTVVGP